MNLVNLNVYLDFTTAPATRRTRRCWKLYEGGIEVHHRVVLSHVIVRKQLNCGEPACETGSPITASRVN